MSRLLCLTELLRRLTTARCQGETGSRRPLFPRQRQILGSGDDTAYRDLLVARRPADR